MIPIRVKRVKTSVWREYFLSSPNHSDVDHRQANPTSIFSEKSVVYGNSSIFHSHDHSCSYETPTTSNSPSPVSFHTFRCHDFYHVKQYILHTNHVAFLLQLFKMPGCPWPNSLLWFAYFTHNWSVKQPQLSKTFKS